MDLVLYKLGREANTRRPTLPPSALILDDKTTAAIKKKTSIVHIQSNQTFETNRWQHQEYHFSSAAFV